MIDHVQSRYENTSPTNITFVCTDLTKAFPEFGREALFDADGFPFPEVKTTHVTSILQAAGQVTPLRIRRMDQNLPRVAFTLALIDRGEAGVNVQSGGIAIDLRYLPFRFAVYRCRTLFGKIGNSWHSGGRVGAKDEIG